jgi:hypothetical protein
LTPFPAIRPGGVRSRCVGSPRTAEQSQPRLALQLPPALPPTVYEPDIEFPDTVPEYVIAADPTVPKVILEPLTSPFRRSVVDGAESLIVPLRAVPFCCHDRWNVPLYAPL